MKQVLYIMLTIRHCWYERRSQSGKYSICSICFMNNGKFFIARSFRIERYTIWIPQENHGWMNTTLIRTNTSLRSLSVASLNRIRIFPIPTQKPSIDNSVAKQLHRMRTFWCARCLATYKFKHSLGLDFITEHEKGFRWMLQSKLCALMEARENCSTIVWLCRIEKRELTPKRVRARESWLEMITFLFCRIYVAWNQFDIACARIYLYIYDIDMQATITLVTYQYCYCLRVCTTRIESKHLHCQTIVCHVCLLQMPPSNCYCFHFTLHHQIVWHLKVKLQYELYLHWMTCPYL